MWHGNAQRLAVILILLAGFGLRAAFYDYHGVEGDEAFSLVTAHERTGDLIGGLMAGRLDIHPPLHFLALKFWGALIGESLFSLRVMNFLLDMLVAALVVRMGGRAASYRVGVAAAILWVVAPTAIYGSWLIRMYMLLAVWAAAGAACALEGWRAEGRRRAVWGAGAAFFGLLACYTHMIGVIVFVALVAISLIDAIFRPGRRRWGLISFALSGLIGLLYLPHGLMLLEIATSGRTLGASYSEVYFVEPYSVPGTMLLTVLGHRLPADYAVRVLLPVMLIAAAVLAWQRFRAKIAPILIMVGVLLAGMSALILGLKVYKARYMVPLLPFVLVALTAGIAGMWRRFLRGALILALVVTAGAGFLLDFERYWRDDWLAAADFIERHEHPGDRVIVIPDWGLHPFQFHYEGNADVKSAFPAISPDMDIDPALREMVGDAGRVWYIRYQPEVSDPGGRAAAWFRERAATLTEIFPAILQVHYYDFAPRLDALPADVRPLDATFGKIAALRGVYLPVTEGPARDNRIHPPSNWVYLELYWETLAPGADFVPRARLTDPYAQVYGAAIDRPNALINRQPVPSWEPGAIYRAAYDLNLNPETPPGTYNVEVMALDAATGQPLPSEGADAGEHWVIAGQFRVK